MSNNGFAYVSPFSLFLTTFSRLAFFSFQFSVCPHFSNVTLGAGCDQQMASDRLSHSSAARSFPFRHYQHTNTRIMERFSIATVTVICKNIQSRHQDSKMGNSCIPATHYRPFRWSVGRLASFRGLYGYHTAMSTLVPILFNPYKLNGNAGIPQTYI